MARKAKTIRLEAATQSRDFDMAHAERLLRMANNGGWRIAESEPYEFKNGEIVKKEQS